MDEAVALQGPQSLAQGTDIQKTFLVFISGVLQPAAQRDLS